MIAARAESELGALVAVSSPSGDLRGAEEAMSVTRALLPAQAEIERVPCSSPGFAPDLIARVRGTGRSRVLLLGHVDTVVTHDTHRPIEARDGRLYGSGAVDMKGGVVLAIGVMRALTEMPASFAEVSLLLVTDEEWRTEPFAHAERFRGFDGCLSFEAGERTREGEEGVVVRRKAAGTLRVEARGRAAHSGSAPDDGRNALLALAAAAKVAAAHHAPDGPERLSVVPTILRSGDAFNVVPAAGELYCDLRADRLAAFAPVLDGVPEEVGGATLETTLVREWPGMDAVADTESLLRAAGELLGRSVMPVHRGGASDASHLATVVPVTVDGLGPRGGGAHTPKEFVRADSFPSRAEVALAVAAALLDVG
jgi:glutamate carboxypeptidase